MLDVEPLPRSKSVWAVGWPAPPATMSVVLMCWQPLGVASVHGLAVDSAADPCTAQAVAGAVSANAIAAQSATARMPMADLPTVLSRRQQHAAAAPGQPSAAPILTI
jgi:hypothetical protein